MPKESIPHDQILTLSSPAGVPFPFSVAISNAYPAGNDMYLDVTGTDPATEAKKTIQYPVSPGSHDCYLNLLHQLSEDFSLCIPRNRQPAIKHQPGARYTTVLDKNLARGMQYGYGDPAVLRVENPGECWYYLVVTSNDAPDSFPICRSRDLDNWEFVGFVFPEGCKPSWATDKQSESDYWAPEIHKVGGEFRVYFVARHKHNLALCIGMARSLHPAGPYVPDEAPILNGNAIDPHLFVETPGDALLFWKEDNNGVWPALLINLLYDEPKLIAQLFTDPAQQATASLITTIWPWLQTLNPMEAFMVEQTFIESVTGSFSAFKHELKTLLNGSTKGLKDRVALIIESMRTPVYAGRLSANGSALAGDKVLIMENDLPWEAHLVEGMWVTKNKDTYYLFYSGNDFSTDQYGIGVALAHHPLGPYNKIPEPVIKSTDEWWAPGHPSVAMGADGRSILFMHAFFPHKAGYKKFRALLSLPLDFEQFKP